MGGAPLASIRLGAGDRKGAEQILGNSTTLLLGTAAVLTVFFSLFKRPLLMAFGASEDTVGYALEYLSIYLLGTVFVQLALGLNTFISAQGKALTSMLSVLIGAVLNIVLDPILFLGSKWGCAARPWPQFSPRLSVPAGLSAFCVLSGPGFGSGWPIWL